MRSYYPKERLILCAGNDGFINLTGSCFIIVINGVRMMPTARALGRGKRRPYGVIDKLNEDYYVMA